MTSMDEKDTELYRHHALLAAIAWAQDSGVTADDAYRKRAEHEIATEHGLESFTELEWELAATPEFLTEVNHYRDVLALAKRVRIAWFDTPMPTHG
jgi:hypothetical protein